MLQIPVFVIALSGSKRLHLLEEDMKEQGIDFSLIEAIDGKNIELEDCREIFNPTGTFARLGYQISAPLLGCALSHNFVYETASKLDKEWIVVLEEDVRLKKKFLDKIEFLIENFASDEPIICMLFTRGNRFVKRETFSEGISGRFIFDFASIPGQTAAYLINKRALELAIHNKVVCGPPDWPNWSYPVQFKGTYPFLVEETGEQSSIGTPPLSRLSYWARNISILTGVHFFRYRRHYENLQCYTLFELKPFFYRILWKIKGSKLFPPGKDEGLWIL